MKFIVKDFFRPVILLLLLFSVSGMDLAAQALINFPLRTVISNPEKKMSMVHLAVQGKPDLIKAAVEKSGGTFKYSFSPTKSSGKESEICFISLPAKNIEPFAKNEFVTKIEYINAKPFLLNDTMKVNMNVNAVHQGQYPLLQSFDGTGVIVGIIDAGIDLNHPDFLDSSGRTRVLSVWDQTLNPSSPFFDPLRVPQPYNYGQQWDSSAINGGYHHHTEQSNFYGHGSHVSGIAAGDGSADSVPIFKGMAPNADLVIVSSDFGADNWLQTVADAVTCIFHLADSLNKPCVINISAGTYSGSHDGKDFVGQYINDLVTQNSGRAKAVVCAGGNSGDNLFYHLRTSPASTSEFTWFTENESLSVPGYAPDGAVYFELFSDTADFNSITFSFNADKISNGYELRATSNDYYIINLFNGTYSLDANGIYSDQLKNALGQKLADIHIAAETVNEGETYILYVLLSPDSSGYNYRFTTSGTGMFDIWSAEFLGSSDMVYDSLPSVSQFPDIAAYSMPDNAQTVVSSFSCAPDVITVANYTNRHSYISYQGTEVLTNVNPGSIFPSSSKGPTRDGRTKPDIAAPGAQVLSSAPLDLLALWKNINDPQLAQGGFHSVKNGTSMASPAVAGLVALYFQKCPDADIEDVFEALYANAKTDLNTGAVPNYTWGYGKADAFEMLKSSNFPVSVSNPLSISCPGPVRLNIDSTFSLYQWNHGASGKTSTVSQTGIYFATVTDQKGCKARTDSIAIFIDENIPSPDIMVNGSAYFCEGDSVQLSYPDTFSYYLWNTGNTTKSIYAKSTDFFRVTATAVNGCNYLPDSVLVWAKSVLPEPAIFQNGNILIASPANVHQWYLNGQLISAATDDSLVISQSGYYRVEVFHANGCGTLSDSVFIMLSGDKEISTSHQFRIFPNPGDGIFNLEISESFYNVKIYNALGKIIIDLERIDLPVLELDLSSQPAGIYFLKMEDWESRVFTRKLVVEK